MSVVYSIGDEAARKQLLDGLVGVLQGALVAVTTPLLAEVGTTGRGVDAAASGHRCCVADGRF